MGIDVEINKTNEIMKKIQMDSIEKIIQFDWN